MGLLSCNLKGNMRSWLLDVGRAGLEKCVRRCGEGGIPTPLAEDELAPGDKKGVKKRDKSRSHLNSQEREAAGRMFCQLTCSP